MGCAECKFCKQEEEKNQFDYPPDSKNSNKNALENSLHKSGNNNDFIKEFEEKIKYIGNFITEEEFEAVIPEEANKYFKNENFLAKLKNVGSYKIKPVEFENGNIYYGQWNQEFEMEGYGKYYLREEKVLAEGIWKKGELKNARIFFPNGDFYEGEMDNSVYNGKGKLITQNQDEYIGQFVDGEKNGGGKLRFEDGTEYEGNFVKNKFSGKGHMKWADGIEYIGNFSDNYLEGEGILIKNNGEKYEGTFEKNFFHGKGKYTYSNGDEYEGNFEYGIRKGKGVYRKKNGFIFEGFWDNNIPNGHGKININGNLLKCNFHNGILINEQINERENYDNEIGNNFYAELMSLSSQKLNHLENTNNSTSQYRAGTMLSFLED